MDKQLEDISKSSLTRRSVLRRGAFVAAATTVGLGAFSMPVAASICPRTPGYWMNHDWATPTTYQTVNARLGLNLTSNEDGQDYLRQPPRGDKGMIMAFHLIATINNFQEACRHPDTREYQEDAVTLDDFDNMRQVRHLAEDWLEASNFPGPVRSWDVPSAPYSDGETLKNYLDAYNNGNLFGCVCRD